MPLPIALQEQHQIPLRLSKSHLHYVEKFIDVLTIFVKPDTGFWQLLYFSVNCFHLTLNYFLKKKNLKHPKLFWMYKLKNYVLSGNLTVLISGDWILCCGRRVTLIPSWCSWWAPSITSNTEPHYKPEPAALSAGECWWHTVYAQQPCVLQ